MIDARANTIALHSAIQAASVTAAAQRDCPNEDNANQSKAYCFVLSNAVLAPSVRGTTAPVTIPQFIALAAFFTASTLGALGAFT